LDGQSPTPTLDVVGDGGSESTWTSVVVAIISAVIAVLIVLIIVMIVIVIRRRSLIHSSEGVSQEMTYEPEAAFLTPDNPVQGFRNDNAVDEDDGLDFLGTTKEEGMW
jgi:hypothetical protein